MLLVTTLLYDNNFNSLCNGFYFSTKNENKAFVSVPNRFSKDKEFLRIRGCVSVRFLKG